MSLKKILKDFGALLKARDFFVMVLYSFNRFKVSFIKNILRQRFITRKIQIKIKLMELSQPFLNKLVGKTIIYAG